MSLRSRLGPVNCGQRVAAARTGNPPCDGTPTAFPLVAAAQRRALSQRPPVVPGIGGRVTIQRGIWTSGDRRTEFVAVEDPIHFSSSSPESH